MAHLRRVHSTRHLDAAGNRVPKGTPGATRVRVRNAKWYAANVPGHPPDKRIPLSANKRVAEQMLAELVAKGERGLLGLPDAAALHKQLADYLAGYRDHMAANGSVPRHVATTGNRLSRVIATAKLGPAADLLQPGVRVRVEQAVRALAAEGGFGAKTVGYYLRDVRTFARYLHEELEILPRNPLAVRRRKRGKRAKADAEPGRRRRVLTPAELARLIEAAGASDRTPFGLTGAARAVLYATAAGTGFRSEELSKLRVGSFDLTADPPVLVAAGRDTKNAEAARLPLPAGLVAMLAPLLAGRPKDELVWPNGTWWTKTAKLIRADLGDAGIAYKTDTPAGPEYADFHALRHFFSTNIVSGGASVKAAQKLARHSTPVLTIGTYTHTTEREMAEAVARLPVLGAAGPSWKLTREQLETAAVILAHALAAVLTPPSSS